MKNKLMMLIAALAIFAGANVMAWDFNRVAVVNLTKDYPKLANGQDLTVQLSSDLKNVSLDAARKGNMWYIGCSTAGTSCTIIRVWNDGTANPTLGSITALSGRTGCTVSGTRICPNTPKVDPKFCYAACQPVAGSGSTGNIALDHNGFFTLATINRSNATSYTEAKAALFPAQ